MSSASELTQPSQTTRRTSLVPELLVCITCFILLMATSPVLPLVWDEPNAIERADWLAIWLRLWTHREPGQAAPWESSVVRHLCRYTTVIEGHPDFYGFVIATGRLASAGWLPPKESYRFGPILLFAVATGFVFYRLRRQHSIIAASTGVACLITMPRLFAHAHFASIDGPLMSCWLMTWATFEWARRSRTGCLAWGVLLGLTMSCKFTGWLAIGGFLAWSLVYRDRAGCRVCLLGMAIASFIFVNLNPMLWDDPIGGLQQFFALNLHRADHGLNIPTQFFGTRYDMRHPLPWYNSLAWLAMTVPVGTLLLAGFGIIGAVRNWRHKPSEILLALQTGILVVVKALPMSPPHDAERLFLPSFAFLAALAGIGAAEMLNAARAARWPAWLPRFALAVGLLSGCAETVWYSPQWLSYYSPVIAGLRGAARLGMEPTYYWDGLDREVIGWLESQPASGNRVSLSVSAEWARIMNRDSGSTLWFSAHRQEDFDWYILQNRPGFWSATDRELVQSQTPVFAKTIRDPAAGIGP